MYPSGKGRAVRDGYKEVYTNELKALHGDDIHFWYGSKEALVAKPHAHHLRTIYPHAKIAIFPKMNHGQLLVDNPKEVARRIIKIFTER